MQRSSHMSGVVTTSAFPDVLPTTTPVYIPYDWDWVAPWCGVMCVWILFCGCLVFSDRFCEQRKSPSDPNALVDDVGATPFIQSTASSPKPPMSPRAPWQARATLEPKTDYAKWSPHSPLAEKLPNEKVDCVENETHHGNRVLHEV